MPTTRGRGEAVPIQEVVPAIARADYVGTDPARLMTEHSDHRAMTNCIL